MYFTPFGVARLSCSVFILFYSYIWIIIIFFVLFVKFVQECVLFCKYYSRWLCFIHLLVSKKYSRLLMLSFFSLKDLCALYTFRCCTTRQVRSTYNFVVLKYISHCLDGYVVLFFILDRCVFIPFGVAQLLCSILIC